MSIADRLARLERAQQAIRKANALTAHKAAIGFADIAGECVRDLYERVDLLEREAELNVLDRESA